MNLPIKDHLSQADLIKWGTELISYFIVPVVLVFLTTLQSHDFQIALGAAYGTALACAINLLSKYKEGVDPKDIAGMQKTDVTQPVVQADVQQTEPTPTGK